MNTNEIKNNDLSPEKILEEKNLDRSKFFLNGKPKKSSKIGDPQVYPNNDAPKLANPAGQQSPNSQNPPPEPLKIPYGLFSGFIFLLLKVLNIAAGFFNYQLIEDQKLVELKIIEADRAYTDFLNLNKKQVSNTFKIFLSICSMFTSLVTLFKKKESKQQAIVPLTLIKEEKNKTDA